MCESVGGNRKKRGGKRRAASCTEEGKEEARGGGESRGGRGGRGRGGRGGTRRRSQSKKMETDTSTAPGAAFHVSIYLLYVCCMCSTLRVVSLSFCNMRGRRFFVFLL